MGTQALWNVYPSKVRHWINRHGGLSRTMIFMQGSDLHGIVASCDATRTVTAQNHRSSYHRAAARHPARYYTASAASPGR
jgi:hypothetical protein